MEKDLDHDNGLDKIKGILIIYVVFGHVMEEIRLDGFLGVIRSVIYSFHMPAFIFISGYFAKNLKKTYDSAFASCLLPFAVFNTLWLLLTEESWYLYMLQPVYVFWFMLSLFFWRVSIPVLSKIRGVLWISFVLSLYVGLIGSADRFLSISRTLSFLPFYLLGFLCSEENLSRIRKIPHILCILLLGAMFFLTALMNIKQFVPVKMYEFIQSYEKCGISDKFGILQRGIILLFAMIIIVCLLNLAGLKESLFCKIGRRTAAIYLLSSFIIHAIFHLIVKYNGMGRIVGNWKLSILLSVVLTAAVLLLCGNHYVDKGYHAAMKKISALFVREILPHSRRKLKI